MITEIVTLSRIPATSFEIRNIMTSMEDTVPSRTIGAEDLEPLTASQIKEAVRGFRVASSDSLFGELSDYEQSKHDAYRSVLGI